MVPRAVARGRKCPNVRGLSTAGQEGDASHDWVLRRAPLVAPDCAVADGLLGGLSTQSRLQEAGEGGRLYRRELLEPPVPPATRLELVRGILDVSLSPTQSKGPPRSMISSRVPLLLFGNFHWFNLVLLVLIALAAIATAYVVAFHSLNRLFFVELLGSWRSRKVPSIAALLAEPGPARMLATYYDDEAVSLLRAHPGCAELTTLSAANPRVELWFVPDFLSWLEKPGGVAAFETATQKASLGGAARVLVFSTPELLEKLSADARRRVTSLLKDTRRGLAPRERPDRCAEPGRAREPLAREQPRRAARVGAARAGRLRQPQSGQLPGSRGAGRARFAGPAVVHDPQRRIFGARGQARFGQRHEVVGRRR